MKLCIGAVAVAAAITAAAAAIVAAAAVARCIRRSSRCGQYSWNNRRNRNGKNRSSCCIRQEPEQPQELDQPLLQPQDEHLLQEPQMLEQELQELLEHVIFNQNLLFSGLLHPILPAGKV